MDKAAKLERYFSYLEKDKDNLQLLHDTYNLAIDLKDIDTCKKTIEIASNINPNNEVSTGILAHWSMLNQDWSKAISYYSDLAHRTTDDFVVAYNLATCFALSGQYADCINTLNSHSAELSDSNKEKVNLLLAQCHHNLFNYEQAKDFVRIIPKSSLLYPEAQDLLSLIDWDLGILDLPSDFNPDGEQSNSYRANIILAESKAQAGEYNESTILFEKALSTNPDNSRAQTGLSFCSLMVGDIEKANLFIKQAIKRGAINETQILLYCLTELLLGKNPASNDELQTVYTQEKYSQFAVFFEKLYINTANADVDITEITESLGELLNNRALDKSQLLKNVKTSSWATLVNNQLSPSD